jgi:hypothetical protein
VPARARAAPGIPATWGQVPVRRVAAHHVDAPSADGLIPLARRLSGLHAQPSSSAEVSIWLRTGGAGRPGGPSRTAA